MLLVAWTLSTILLVFPAFSFGLFYSRIPPSVVPGYRLVSKRINGPFLLFWISGYAAFPGERDRRCGGASSMVSEPVRPLKPLGMVVLPCYCVVWHLLSPFLLEAFTYEKTTHLWEQKVQNYRTTNLQLNYLHICYDTPSVSLCSSMQETGQRRFINSVKYLPACFNTTQPDVWSVMIKRPSWLFIFYVRAFRSSVLKWPYLL